MLLDGVRGLRRRWSLGLQRERTPLHPGHPVTQLMRRIGQRPGVDDGLDGGLDVSALQCRFLRLPGGLELERRLQAGRWGRDERERRHAAGRDHRRAERHRASEGVADERCALDGQLVHRPQHIRPRRLLAGRDPRLTEAGEIHGDSPVAGVGQVLQVL
jgi:hypothetical protein